MVLGGVHTYRGLSLCYWSIGMPVASPTRNRLKRRPASGESRVALRLPLDVVEPLLGVGPPDTRVPRTERQAPGL
jgi:hypothetical protein